MKEKEKESEKEKRTIYNRRATFVPQIQTNNSNQQFKFKLLYPKCCLRLLLFLPFLFVSFCLFVDYRCCLLLLLFWSPTTEVNNLPFLVIRLVLRDCHRLFLTDDSNNNSRNVVEDRF